MQVPGARDVAVEFFTLSKSYNMPGWRVGFCVGNREMIAALTRLKSYFDYGIFAPVQVASIAALNGPQDCVGEIVETYRSRRDVAVDGLNRARDGRSRSRKRHDVRVGADPGALPRDGLAGIREVPAARGESGGLAGGRFWRRWRRLVRFALIENEHRTRQAMRGIKQALANAPASKVRRIATA